jgi:glucose-1-phosphate cytidylyltransferase
MKVVVLCGGSGTRLREETEFRPKPLVEIGGKPILWHIMKLYSHYDFRDFVCCLGYRGNMIKEYFLNYDAMNNDFTIALGGGRKMDYHQTEIEKPHNVTLVDAGLDAQTGTRVKRVEAYVDGDDFMVTYGDGLSNIDIADLVKFHRSHGKIATVSVATGESRFGVVTMKGDGLVTGFAEKPKTDHWINAGFFVFKRDFFRYLRNDDDCILEREPLQTVAQEGQLMAYQHDGFFYAMDTQKEHMHLNEIWRSGNAPWAVWENGKPSMLKRTGS